MKHFMLSFLILFISGQVLAQQDVKPDIIVKLNGEELKGKVVEVTDTEVKFTYVGETAVYTLKKTDLLKITYSSGRLESFSQSSNTNEPKTQSPPTNSNSSDTHNKVAILPFAFIKDGNAAVDVLSEKVQAECYSYLTKYAPLYTLVDPRTTNAILIKAGINKENIKGYTMDELCKTLGVEYIIDGIVSVNRSTQTNYQSNNGTVKTNNNSKTNTNNNKTYNSSGYSTNTQNYETSINLSIYNDKGNSVFSQERKSFFTTQDAYKSALEYLLKRCPLHSK